MVQKDCLFKVECVIMLILCKCYFPVQLLANSVQSYDINHSVRSLAGGATDENATDDGGAVLGNFLIGLLLVFIRYSNIQY